MRFPAFMFPHTASVEAYGGDSALGPVYGASSSVRCLLEEKRKLVKDSLGAEAVSGATLYCQDGTWIPSESRVTVNGVKHTVIAVETFSAGNLPLPGSVVVYLT